MSDSPIPSFLVSDVSKSLRSLTKNERFAWVAHQKWAPMSKALRSLTKNERMCELRVFLRESLICSFLGKKRAICSENRWVNSQPCKFTLFVTDLHKKWRCGNFRANIFLHLTKPKMVYEDQKIIINIERPTKNALLLSKLTNLSSEWQKG